jgi:plasmid stabilization system protein ParE
VNVGFHPAAEKDLATDVKFYRKEAGSAVANRFIAEIDRVVNLLIEFPGLGRL